MRRLGSSERAISVATSAEVVGAAAVELETAAADSSLAVPDEASAASVGTTSFGAVEVSVVATTFVDGAEFTTAGAAVSVEGPAVVTAGATATFGGVIDAITCAARSFDGVTSVTAGATVSVEGAAVVTAGATATFGGVIDAIT